MKTIKIFLASSEELKQERLELADLVENLNQRLSALGLQIQLVKWEYLDASMGPKHKQEEYNEALRDCEMCLVLYWTRFGDYTTIELDTAYQELCAGHNPKKLYVYFKDGAELSPELQDFRDSFPERYGHFYNHFQNVDTLKAEFLLQFIDYQKNYLQSSKLIEVKDGQVCIGGKVYVDLKNVPFAGNNEEYNLLMKSIKKTQKLLSVTDPDDPEYREYAIELAELKERQKQMENSLWDTALMITQLSTTQCSERLKRAMDLFSQGDNKGALAVLNEEEINRDINHNLLLIQLGEEGKKGLAINIDEMLLKIKALMTERKEKWYKDVDGLYCKCIEVGRGNLSAEKMIEILIFYGCFLANQKQLDKEELILKEALGLEVILELESPQTAMLYKAMIQNNLASVYIETQRCDESEEMAKEALETFRRLAANNPQYESHVTEPLITLALLYSDAQHYKESEKMLREALKILRHLTMDNPQIYEKRLAIVLNNLANLCHNTGRFHESEIMLNEAREIYKRLLENNSRFDENGLAMTLNNLATLYADTLRFGASEEMFIESLAIYRRLTILNPLAFERTMTSLLYNLAFLYFNTRRLNECESTYKEYLEIRRRYASNSDLATALGNLAFIENLLGQFNEAEQLSIEAISIDSSQLLYTDLASALLLQGKYKEAEAIYLEYKDEIPDYFLDDFEEFEAAGIIPEERKADVERIKKMLMEE